MSNPNSNTTDQKIHDAAAEISRCISSTLLTMAPQLAQKFELTDPQLAVAMVIANMHLLAGGAAGIIVGHPASDEQYEATTGELIRGIQPVIAKALEFKD